MNTMLSNLAQRVSHDLHHTHFMHPDPDAPACVRIPFYNIGLLNHLRAVMMDEVGDSVVEITPDLKTNMQMMADLRQRVALWNDMLRVAHLAWGQPTPVPLMGFTERLPEWAQGDKQARLASEDGVWVIYSIYISEADRHAWDVVGNNEHAGDYVAKTCPTMAEAKWFIQSRYFPQYDRHVVLHEQLQALR